MKRGIYILPNVLTICNLFLGFYACISSIKGNFEYAAFAIIGAAVFDGLDGWVARLTHSNTKFGIEFDSLADVITFGISPAIMLHEWVLNSFGRIGFVAAFAFVACGALRLARYNIQTGSSEAKYFTGLPIPGAAIVVASMVIFCNELWSGIDARNYPILMLTFVLAFLMVSSIKYHGIKEIDLHKRKPFWILVAIVIGIVVIVIQPPVMLFVFSMIYITWGLVEWVITYRKKIKAAKSALKGGDI